MDEKVLEGMRLVRDLAEKSIRDLSRVRAIMLKTGATEEDVTHFISSTGERYGKIYEKMTLEQIMLDITADLLKAMANTED